MKVTTHFPLRVWFVDNELTKHVGANEAGQATHNVHHARARKVNHAALEQQIANVTRPIARGEN